MSIVDHLLSVTKRLISSKIEKHPEFVGERFLIDGGDGDQTLFGAPMYLERVKAAWFDGDAFKRSNSWLMRVVSDKHCGLVFAISPRTFGTIGEGIAADGWKSVVVSGLPEQPGCTAQLYPECAAGGMTFMEHL